MTDSRQADAPETDHEVFEVFTDFV